LLTAFTKGKSGIEKCSALKEAKWIHLVAPTQEELDTVSSELGIFPDFLKYSLDEEETSHVEKDEGQILITIKVPDPRHEGEYVRYETIPLGIIIHQGRIITICIKEPPFMENILQFKWVNRLIEDHVRFLFHIFLRTANLYLRHLRLIDHLTNDYEQELHRSVRNEELIKLLNLEKSLVYFNTSLKANDIVMARLESGRYLPISEENEDILEDARIENQRAIEMAKIFSDILSGLMDAYASVISNNLNMVVKFLTAVTIVLMFPNLVASIYGMNISLPFQASNHAFFMIMAFSFILSGLVVYIFIKKRMF
jgi:magnesium transporter